MEEVESSYRSEMMDGEGWKMMQPNTNKQLVQIKTRSSSMQVVKEEIEEEEVAGGRGRRRGGLRRSVSGRVREQRARLYIMRRCVSLLISSTFHD
ncbi:Os11g0706500 [Oryza sativa Japonica Group]|uniref:Os11g0706500 protein n=2 Tax=Oryza sativa subsp. japonica TaxID=39947 RepID=A0A0P0Y5U4_ORYSJ|nr:Os11g0706500 [Oryza sativa Japonica Group]